MSEPFKVSKAIAVVDVAAVLPGDQPAIRVVYHAENPNGIARQFTRQIPVPDAVLFQRILSSVKEGEQIEATTVNEWYDTGYVSYLADFRKITELQTEAIVTKGAISLTQNNITQSDIKQIVIQPKRNTKTKVQK